MQNATIPPKKSYKKLLSLLLVAVLIAGSLYLSKSGFFKGMIFLGSGTDKLTIKTVPNLLVNPTLTITDATDYTVTATTENPKIILGKETIFNFQVGNAEVTSLNKQTMASVIDPLINCSNGTIDTGEICDASLDNDESGNDSNCSYECVCDTDTGYTLISNICTQTCGNGTVDAGEFCDGPNCINNCKACETPTYTLQDGSCVHVPCGNGLLDTGEACDSALVNSSLTAGNQICNSSCQIACAYKYKSADGGTTCTQACGDSVVDRATVGEQCDDGATAGGCKVDCSGCETGYVMNNVNYTCIQNTSGALCGNGLVDSGESCDGNPNCKADCSGCETGYNLYDVLGLTDQTKICLKNTVAQDKCHNEVLDANEGGESCDGNIVDYTNNCDGEGECACADGYLEINGTCTKLCGNGTVDEDTNEVCEGANCNSTCSACKEDSNLVDGICRLDGYCTTNTDCTTDGETCNTSTNTCECPTPTACPEEYNCGTYVNLCGNGVDCATCPTGQTCSDVYECVATPIEEGKCSNGNKDEGEYCDAELSRDNYNGSDCGDTNNDTIGCVCDNGYEEVNGSCIALCGNGEVDTGEECDRTTGISDNMTCSNACKKTCESGFDLIAGSCQVAEEEEETPTKKVKFTVNPAVAAATMKKNGVSLAGQNDAAGYDLEGEGAITSFSFQATTVPDTAFNTNGVLEDALTITYINGNDTYDISFDLVKENYACGNLIGDSTQIIGLSTDFTGVKNSIDLENAKARSYALMGYTCTPGEWTAEDQVTKKIGETIDIADYDNLTGETLFEDPTSTIQTVFKADTIGQAIVFKDATRKYKIINIIAQDAVVPPAPRCGDNAINGSEECDGTNIASKTCAQFNHNSGTVTCSSTCTLNVSNCSTTYSSGGGGGGGGVFLPRNKKTVKTTTTKGKTGSTTGTKTERRVAVEFANISLPSKNLKFDSKIATQFIDVKDTFFLKDVIYNMSKIRYGKQQRPLIVGIIKTDEFGQPIVKNGKIVKEFKPNQTMDMAQYLKVLLGAMDFENSKYCDLKDAGYKKAMSQFPAVEGWAGTELRRILIGAINAGIITKADVAGLYNPMSRGAAVKILIKLKTAVDEVKLAKFDAKKSVFKDVKTSNKDADYIYTAETLGLSNVFTDSNAFDSAKKITRADGINAVYKLYLSADETKDAAPTTKKKTTTK